MAQNFHEPAAILQFTNKKFTNHSINHQWDSFGPLKKIQYSDYSIVTVPFKSYVSINEA